MKEFMGRPIILCLLPLLMAAQCGQQTPPLKNATDITAPTIPFGVNATAQDSQVILSWKVNKENDVTAYGVYWNTTGSNIDLRRRVSAQEVFDAGFNRLTVTNVKNNEVYFFAVTAIDKAGNESELSELVTAMPSNDQTNPPATLLSSSPAYLEENVALDTTVTVTFSKAMHQASTEASFKLDLTFEKDIPLACDFSWSSDTRTLTCKPNSNLLELKSYRVTIAETARDETAKALADEIIFTFITGGRE